MIPAYAMSWIAFMDTMRRNGLDDSNIESKDKTALIQIMGQQDLVDMPFWFKKDHPNVLSLVFDDTEVDAPVTYLDGSPKGNIYTLSDSQASQVVNFVKANKDALTFIVHCAAGISRSGSVAKFIMEYTAEEGENSDKEFHLINSHCSPKAGFMKTLREAAQRKPNEKVPIGNQG